jgi:alpha-glucoside transport system permease protein
MSTNPTPAPSLVQERADAQQSPAEVPRTSAPRATKGGGEKRSWLAGTVLFVICVLWLVPAVGLLVTSFRPRAEAETSGWWTALLNPLSSQWTLANYDAVLFDNNFAQAFVNSIVVSVPATVLPILMAAFAAYAFTFMRFPGREALFAVVVGLLVVPIQVAFIPLLRFFGSFDLIGQFVTVWLIHAGFAMPLAVYILRNYMGTLPVSIIESAKVDGASHFTTFWRLVIPMSVPALAAFGIFQFLWVWNDLLIALIFLGQGENSVMTVQLAQLLGRLGEGWQLLTAGAFVTMAVPLLVFLSLQRYFVRGLTAGSVKG